MTFFIIFLSMIKVLNSSSLIILMIVLFILIIKLLLTFFVFILILILILFNVAVDNRVCFFNCLNINFHDRCNVCDEEFLIFLLFYLSQLSQLKITFTYLKLNQFRLINFVFVFFNSRYNFFFIFYLFKTIFNLNNERFVYN